MRIRLAWPVAVALTAGLVLAGCSSSSTSETSSPAAAEPAASSAAAAESSAPAEDTAPSGDVTIAVVTHGAQGDAFWSDVKTGVEDAGAQTGVNVDYQSSGDLNEQAQLIDAAVSKGVQGLVVSIPSLDALQAPIKKATDAGIPVVVINSGQDDWQALGAVGYVGQDEKDAGAAAGTAMKNAGVTKMLCVNITQVVQAVDQRCESATETFGGPVETVRIELTDLATGVSQVAASLQADPSIDGVLSLGGGVYDQSVGGIEQAGSKAKLGTFDVNDTIKQGLADGKVAFAIDQQPYVQGYQAVVNLAMLNLKNVIIGGGTMPIASGPRVLTAG